MQKPKIKMQLSELLVSGFTVLIVIGLLYRGVFAYQNKMESPIFKLNHMTIKR